MNTRILLLALFLSLLVSPVAFGDELGIGQSGEASGDSNQTTLAAPAQEGSETADAERDLWSYFLGLFR